MKQELIDKLNWQIANEMGSAVLYRNMYSYLSKIGMVNLAEYYKKQSDGEYSHADGIANFISDRGCDANYTIKEFSIMNKDISSIVEQTYLHEQMVTSFLYELYELACEIEDPLTKVFVHDYLKEQIEEESISLTILDNLRLSSDMLLFDNRIEKITNS